jgi:acyl-coenzyme A synthetase/AMP-(fatty) acid ligase
MNFHRDVVEAAPPSQPALIELDRGGGRRVWTFGEVAAASARFAARLEDEGVRKGDVVLIWVGNRPEWALSMLGCFRLGALAAACPEQLRAKDLRLRLETASPVVVLADERNREELELTAPETPVLWIQDESLWEASEPHPATELDPLDPCLLTFTSGTSGLPKAVVHLQRYLDGQRLQAEHWMGVEPGDVAWCTASSGWSKSARNAFIAPWLRGGTAILHDGRFDAEERLAIVDREGVSTLCMAPTEYRMIAKRARIPRLEGLRSCVAAGEALDPAVVEAWGEATGTMIRDGYGQTETGQLTGFGPGEPVSPGSMGRALPGIDLWLDEGELVVAPRSVPTFFRGYLGAEPVDPDNPWRTGDRVAADEEGRLWFEGRADDIIVSAGYRIGPFEVESALTSHAAVEEAAAVPAPDAERGSIVRAVVVLRAGYEPSGPLVRALQDHVKAETAPYKYPRRIDFVAALPKTASGKIQRALLRERE